MRIRKPFIAFGVLILCGLAEISFGASSVVEDVIVPHQDADVQREFQNVYQAVKNPTIQNATVSSATITNLTVTNCIGCGSQVGQIPGTTTNDNASTGNVGEYIDSTVPLTTITSFNGASGSVVSVATITLTSGDWDVSSLGFCNANGGSITNCSMAISTIANTQGNLGDTTTRHAIDTFSEESLAIPEDRISIASTTPVYLVVAMTYSGGTARFAGNIRARRAR